mmetsp:Transcript_3689/g.11456  ORF Transcript_3689/g.11456 Transcript_3689/m.11456 type:complete len:110 (+) Transcript_3689:44-373(+)
MARQLLASCILATAAALAPVARTVVKAPVASSALPKVAPALLAAPAALAPLAANAFQGSVFGLPINLVVAFAPVILVALPIALIVIGPGALQQAGRVLKGDSEKYFGEN